MAINTATAKRLPAFEKVTGGTNGLFCFDGEQTWFFPWVWLSHSVMDKECKILLLKFTTFDVKIEGERLTKIQNALQRWELDRIQPNKEADNEPFIATIRVEAVVDQEPATT